MTAAERRYDLDWIRVGAFFLLILYHVGMFYVPWDWHVKSPHTVAWLQPVMQLTNPWRLSLLFLVSGSATRFMADRLAAGELAWRRTVRLAPPLVLAIFVIVPPQSFYEVIEQAGFVGGYGEFYARYVTASGHWCEADGCLITPTYNHMWFVAYLLAYTLVLALLIAFARPFLGWIERRVERLGGWRLIVWPLVVLGLLRVSLYPIFGVTDAFVDDWYNHAVSFGLFLFGFATAKSSPLRAEFIRLRWAALAIAVAAYVGWASYAWIYRAGEAPQALGVVMGFVHAADQWCAIAAVLGFGARHVRRGGPALTYLTLAVFPFYIVHQTIIVVAGHNIAPLGLPRGFEALILIGLTFGGCFLTYEGVRRVDWLRPWFGLKPHPVLARAYA